MEEMKDRRCAGDNYSIATVWDDNDCVEAARTNSTTKQRRVVELAQDDGLLDIRAAPFTRDEAWANIAAVHDPAYVEAVRTGLPRHLAESQGFRWSPAFAESVARIWSGHAAACRLALREWIILHPVSGAHHAGFASGSGFCTFNFLVGAGRTLLDEGLVAKVGIVDLDAHHGNGTEDLVRGDRRFGLFDISGSSWTEAEHRPGVELHEVDDASEYRRALRMFPGWLDRVRPAIVQYQAGMDPFEDDPVGGICGVDREFLWFRDQFVIGHILLRRIPLVVNLAGGYLDGVTERLHVETIRIAAAALHRLSAGEPSPFVMDEDDCGEVEMAAAGGAA
jgi:acetoin utilization deacetylase AcuC-like enzyme